MDPALVETINAVFKDMPNDTDTMEQLKNLSATYEWTDVAYAQEYVKTLCKQVSDAADVLGINVRTK
ncbi:MAG: hypothetical protein AB7D36_08455 [Oscillospiraceae bacterium]